MQQVRQTVGPARLMNKVSPCIRARPAARRNVVVVKAADHTLAVRVRAYTLRKGDTLENIAKKRSVTVAQLVQLNPDKNPDKMVEGTTILLPSDKLSSRDLEILSGIGAQYRVYPVRTGETLQDILSKRGITDDEFQRLNPGIKIDGLKSDATVLRLPVKFTVREREMLIGSGVLPNEFFLTPDNPFVVGLGALGLICGFVLAWQRFYKDEDEDYVEPEPPAGGSPPIRAI